MAEANKFTRTEQRPVEVPMVRLELTLEEAEFLYRLTNFHITGHNEGWRGVSSLINLAMGKAGLGYLAEKGRLPADSIRVGRLIFSEERT